MTRTSMLWLFVSAILISPAFSAFQPGCSFMNNQCIYNVKLGHEGTCDSTKAIGSTLSGTTSQCCETNKADISHLQTALANLTLQMQQLQQNKQDLSAAQGQLNRTLGDKDQLLKTLAAKEAELSNTQSELANVIKHAGDEIKRLREELANCSRGLNNCNGVLGLQTGKPLVLVGDYHLTYCDFEKSDRCGYTQDKDDQIDWKIHTGSAGSSGPREDHTFGSPKGHYMYLDGRANAHYYSALNQTARLTSPLFDTAQSYCVRFWYNMYGRDVRVLRVYAKVGNGRGYPVWTRSGNQGSAWHLGEISLNAEYTANRFQLTFEALEDAYQSHPHYSNNNYYNAVDNIAIDDIYVYNTTCGNIPTCQSDAHLWKGANHSTSCYTFNLTPQDWYSASRECRQQGANSHLVSVNSAEEQQYLVSLIKNDKALSLAGNYGWYTSGNDERSESHFDWTDTGTPYTSSFTDWHPNQPNNVGNDQDCLLLQYADSNFEWGDVACTEKHTFICEVNMPK